MISIDTNVLLYAQNIDCPEHSRALAFVSDLGASDGVVVCELVLVELYVLLRNPGVLASPLSGGAAAAVCQTPTGRTRAGAWWRTRPS